MSGHSKWATIKHKKGAVDKARGKLFNKIARQLEVAAREGGGDVTTNATLRTVVQKAKAAQMTNDAIDRAVKRGTGENDGGTYEAITYEGYAPGGVAVLIDVLLLRLPRLRLGQQLALAQVPVMPGAPLRVGRAAGGVRGRGPPVPLPS